MLRHIILILGLLAAFTGIASITHAQDTDCLEPRVFPGQTIKITGSVDAAGMPYRDNSTLESPVEGFLPLRAILSTLPYTSLSVCSERRNWYQVSVETENGTRPKWIVDGNGFTYWIEPADICRNGALIEGGMFTTYQHWGHIADMTYLPESDTLVLAFYSRSSHPHASALNHYALNLTTGELTPAEYPDADIFTRDLTDQLGISDWLYERNAGGSGYTIYLSPDREKILYFVPGEPITGCAHNCQPLTGFIANADGTNPVELGQFYTEAGIGRVHWGANERLYLSHFTETGGRYSGEICLDGSCAHSISDMLETDYNLPPEEITAYYPSISPSGQFMALTPMWDGMSNPKVLNLQSGELLDLPRNGSYAYPALWESDDSLWLPIAPDADPDLAREKPYIALLSFDFESGEVRHNNGARVFRTGEPSLGVNTVTDWIRTSRHIVVNYNESIEIFCVSFG